MAALVCAPALTTLTSQVTIYGWSTKPRIKDLKRDSPIVRELPWIGKERVELTSVAQDRRDEAPT